MCSGEVTIGHYIMREMRMFLRKSRVGRDPLVMTMSGVRLGERLLQIGVDDPAVLGALAAKVGLSGHAAVVTLDERSAERARTGSRTPRRWPTST